MPREYKYKLGKTQYKVNLEQIKEGIEAARLALEKNRANREVSYQQLRTTRDETRTSLRIIKSWLRKYPNLPVAREAAEELGSFQDSLDEQLTEIQTKLFLESELTNTTLNILSDALEALYENEEIVSYNLEIPTHLNEQLIEQTVTLVLSQLFSQAEPLKQLDQE